MEYSLMKNNIMFIATFSKDSQQNLDPSASNNVNDYVLKTPATNVRSASPNSVDISDPIFKNLSEHSMGNPKGNIFHTFFVNDTKYNYFDKNYRTSVLLYNRNYGIIKSIGLKVKQQKKGWFWWNKTNAEQIVAGWSTVVYTSTKSIPGITSIFNQNKARLPYAIGVKMKGLFQILIPYDVTLGSVEIASGEYKFTEKDIKPIALKGWNLIKGALQKDNGSDIPVYIVNTGKFEKHSLFDLESVPKGVIYDAQVQNMPGQGGKLKFALSPYIERRYNSEMIDINFDWEIIDIKLDFNAQEFRPFSNSDWLNQAKKQDAMKLFEGFEVESANVFGTSLRGGTWKGIRIRTNK